MEASLRNENLFNIIFNKENNFLCKYALITSQFCMTYNELQLKVESYVVFFKKKGIRKQTVAVIDLPRSEEVVYIILALLQCNVIIMPMNAAYPSQYIHELLNKFSIDFIISDQDSVFKYEGHNKVINLSRSIVPILTEIESFSPELISAEDLAFYMLVPSSTDYLPKITFVKHSAVIDYLYWMKQYLQLDHHDRVLHKTVFYIDIGLWEMLLPLASGATLIIPKKSVPSNDDELIDTIIEQKISVIHFVPIMLSHFLEAPQVEQCTTLKHVVCSGNSLYTEFSQIFFKKMRSNLYNFYGTTETVFNCAAHKCSVKQQGELNPVGQSIAQKNIYILDDKFDIELHNEPGNIVISGDFLVNSYLNDADETRKCFKYHEKLGYIFCTGDIGLKKNNGEFYFLRKASNQVKLGGYRVEIDPIKTFIQKNKLVQSIYIDVIQKSKGFFYLLAYIIFKDSHAVKYPSDRVDQLLDKLKTQLPFFMIPSVFAVIDNSFLCVDGVIDSPRLPNINQMNKISDSLYSMSAREENVYNKH